MNKYALNKYVLNKYAFCVSFYAAFCVSAGLLLIAPGGRAVGDEEKITANPAEQKTDTLKEEINPPKQESNPAEQETMPGQIGKWVQQLGDPSFLVRQRSEAFLIRTGLLAYPELQRAKLSNDLEVARRAESILNKIELSFLSQEDQEIGFWIRQYMVGNDSVTQARIIWLFADPFSVAAGGKGLSTLCRIARFEGNDSLRLEAVKTLIASPPELPPQQKRWYQHIRNAFQQTGNDEMLKTLLEFADVRCAMEETEKKTGEEFQNKIRETAKKTMNLLKKTENPICPGSRIDILLHYAVAELQDYAGLTEDRDKTVAAALAVKSVPVGSMEKQLVDLDDSLPMKEHFYTGRCLRLRYRLQWADAHFQLVMAEGHVSLQSQACSQAANAAMLRADYPAAIGLLDKQIQIVSGQEYTRKFSDSATLISSLKRQKSYCEAKIAEEKGDWKEVHSRTAAYLDWAASNLPGAKPIPAAALTRQAININSPSMAAVVDDDWIILAYKANKMLPQEGDEYYVPRLNQMLWHLWNVIYMSWQPQLLEIKCNRAAWLLAHTDGHNPAALMLIERALRVRPDDPSFLDTLAYVYFSGGKIDEAIQTQEKAVRFAPEVTVFRHALDRFRKEQEKVKAAEKEKTTENTAGKEKEGEKEKGGEKEKEENKENDAAGGTAQDTSQQTSP